MVCVSVETDNMKSRSYFNRNNSAAKGAQLVLIRIPTIYLYKFVLGSI